MKILFSWWWYFFIAFIDVVNALIQFSSGHPAAGACWVVAGISFLLMGIWRLGDSLDNGDLQSGNKNPWGNHYNVQSGHAPVAHAPVPPAVHVPPNPEMTCVALSCSYRTVDGLCTHASQTCHHLHPVAELERQKALAESRQKAAEDARKAAEDARKAAEDARKAAEEEKIENGIAEILAGKEGET